MTKAIGLGPSPDAANGEANAPDAAEDGGAASPGLPSLRDSGPREDAASGGDGERDAAAPTDAAAKPDGAQHDPDPLADGGAQDGSVPDAGASDAAVEIFDAGSDSSGDAAPPEPCRDSVWDGDARVSGTAMVINEIVGYPHQDFSHSDTGEDRFGQTPGRGFVSSTDQYIELRNTGSVVLDVRGFRLDVYDQSFNSSLFETSETSTASEVFTFTAGSSLSALAPGAFMLVGNPSGFLSTDALYVLRSPCNVVLDQVEVGGLSESRDMAGDGVDNGAPGPGQNGRSHGLFDEAIARSAASEDSDDDVTDFRAMFATPLRENIDPPIDTADQSAPYVVAAESSLSFAVTGKLRVELSEALDGPSALHAAEVWADGSPVALGPADLEDADHTILVNPVGRLPFDSEISVTVRGGALGVRDRAGNALPADHTFVFHTEKGPEPAAAIVLNEIVSDPKLDYAAWGFTGYTEDLSVGSDDEWIELLSTSTNAVDLTDYRIVVYRGPNSTSSTRTDFSLGAAHSSRSSVVRVLGTGSDLAAVHAGDYVVIGNPSGSIPNDTYLELRDPAGKLVDAVELGGNGNLSDRGGDGVDNGAPGPGQDGAGLGVADEAVARVPDGVDTDIDAVDFCRAPATLGAANASCAQAPLPPP